MRHFQLDPGSRDRVSGVAALSLGALQPEHLVAERRLCRRPRRPRPRPVSSQPVPPSNSYQAIADSPPPPLPVYDQPPIPSPGYVWTQAIGTGADAAADYYWVPGTWIEPARPGLVPGPRDTGASTTAAICSATATGAQSGLLWRGRLRLRPMAARAMTAAAGRETVLLQQPGQQPGRPPDQHGSTARSFHQRQSGELQPAVRAASKSRQSRRRSRPPRRATRRRPTSRSPRCGPPRPTAVSAPCVNGGAPPIAATSRPSAFNARPASRPPAPPRYTPRSGRAPPRRLGRAGRTRPHGGSPRQPPRWNAWGRPRR